MANIGLSIASKTYLLPIFQWYNGRTIDQRKLDFRSVKGQSDIKRPILGTNSPNWLFKAYFCVKYLTMIHFHGWIFTSRTDQCPIYMDWVMKRYTWGIVKLRVVAKYSFVDYRSQSLNSNSQSSRILPSYRWAQFPFHIQ